MKIFSLLLWFHHASPLHSCVKSALLSLSNIIIHHQNYITNFMNLWTLPYIMGAKGDWDFRISDLVKTLMELIFNPCGEFQWSLEGPVSQIHSPHLLVGAPGIFSDLLRFVKMLKREWGVQKATGSYCTYSSLVKLQPRFLSLQWKTCLWAELQPWYLSL